MKKRLMLALLLCLIVSAAKAEMPGDAPIRVENGMLQPVITVNDLRDTNYTNEGSDILRFCVWVETDHDTDFDGMADLVKALVQVPRAAGKGNTKRARSTIRRLTVPEPWSAMGKTTR